LSNFLVGQFKIKQDTRTIDSLSTLPIIASKTPVNVSFVLHDPSGYFNNFEKTYIWKIDNVTIEAAKTDVLVHTFESGSRNASISMYASANNDAMKVDKHVDLDFTAEIQDPIEKVKFDGKTFIFRNQSLDLNISCVTGTGPFHFCKEFASNGHVYSDDCKTSVIQSDQCLFHASWYFKTAGKFNLDIRVWNNVSMVNTSIAITVGEVMKQTSLTFVVLPVISCILAIVILVFALAFHVQQRKRFTIEVADFDFQARDENLMEKTLYERVRDSLSESFKGRLIMCRREDNNHEDLPQQENNQEVDDGYASTSIHVNT